MLDVFGCKAVVGSCTIRDGVGEGVRAGISKIVGLGWGVPLTCVVPPPLGVRHNECKGLFSRFTIEFWSWVPPPLGVCH